MKKIKLWLSQGSSLVVSIIFSTIMGMGVVGILHYQYTTHKMNHKSFEGNKARYLAESGIQIAMDELNTQSIPFSGTGSYTWANSGSTYTLNRSDIGPVNIVVNYTNPNDVVIQSHGTYQTVTKGLEVHAIKAGTSPIHPIFPGAIASMSDVVTMSAFTVDSYSNGIYNPASPGYNGHIFTKDDSINLKSGAIVRGHIYAPPNPAPTFSTGSPSNGMVYHTAADEAASNNCGGSTGEFSTFRPVAIPPHLLMTNPPSATLSSGGSYGSGHYIGANNLGNLTFTGGFYKIDGNVDLGNGAVLTVQGKSDIYITGNLDLGNSATIVNYTLKADGPDPDALPDVDQVFTLRIYVDGGLTFSQGNEVNMYCSYDVTKLQLYGCGSGHFASPAKKFNIKNGGAFFGFVYAPYYEVEFNNANEVFGAFAVYQIIPKNGSKIHFDERLWGIIDGVAPDKYGLSGWNEI
ncbi:MAG: hypothetical protein JW774_04670 [Candidatus Aureabacteria bacterium]|nr:hypothetical protein [Candidatus Auribacterota bacterium]